MNLEMKRNAATILEYFQTLKEWNKTKFEIDRSSKEIQEDGEVKNLKDELSKIQQLILEKSNLLEPIHQHLNEINQSISNNEDEVNKLRVEATKLNNELSTLTQDINRLQSLQKTRSYTNSSTQSSTSITKKIQYFITIINHDITAVYLDLKKAIQTLNVLILFQYALGLLIALTLLITFLDATSFLFMFILTSYLTWRLFAVVIFYKSNKEKRISDQQTRIREESAISDLRDKRHKLESMICELTTRCRNHEANLNQAKIESDELINQLRSLNNELLDLDHSYNQQLIISQKITEKLVEQLYLNKIQRLSYLEALTQKWLKEDVKYLSERARKKLRLANPEFQNEFNALQADPISVWVGITERKAPNLIVQDELVEQLESKEVLELLNSEDLKSDKAYEGSRRRYRIYEVSIIFLCKEFLSYYTCYFNFVRRIPINEKYSECLYDSIIFTKLQETSYVNPNNDDSKKKSYSKILTISTNSGDNICLQISDDCIQGRISQIDTIANTIRYELRRRMNDSP
jgi:septal ring factor EnvC (AmiA/AmiB activator)